MFTTIILALSHAIAYLCGGVHTAHVVTKSIEQAGHIQAIPEPLRGMIERREI
jgi:hypothetical protein